MKKSLLIILLAGAFTNAQNITAATGQTKGKIEFRDFRNLDLKNLNASEILMSKQDNLSFLSDTGNQKTCNCSNYIAAMAVSNGKVFYIPMTQAKVMNYDVASKQGSFTTIENSSLDVQSQGTFYARMTTTPDGNMYAVNNIGSEMLRISPNGKVQNLGTPGNILSQVKALGDEKFAFGGDMIADAFGNVYIISAKGNVFEINTQTLNSEFLGQISGLPENYTVNGAAVAEDGSVVLGTSSESGFYSLNFDTLQARFLADYDLPVYDLASEFFLKQAQADALNISNQYSLFPTIVKTSELNIVSKSNEANILNVSVWSLNNKPVYNQTLNVKSAGDFKINLNGALQPGIYILKAVNQDGSEVINTKFTLIR